MSEEKKDKPKPEPLSKLNKDELWGLATISEGLNDLILNLAEAGVTFLASKRGLLATRTPMPAEQRDKLDRAMAITLNYYLGILIKSPALVWLIIMGGVLSSFEYTEMEALPESQPAPEPAPEPEPEPVKRGPGRPPGAKNKPKHTAKPDPPSQETSGESGATVRIAIGPGSDA